MNYRKYYSDYYGIKIDSSYAIHHIDFDRNNNNINNLLLLPRKLHSKYHLLINSLTYQKSEIYHGFFDMKASNINKYSLEVAKSIPKTLTELFKWINAKQCNYEYYYQKNLLGEIKIIKNGENYEHN